MEYISYGMNLVDCGNSDVYNSQLIIKIKEKKRGYDVPGLPPNYVYI